MYHALQRIGTLLDVLAPDLTPEQIQDATSNFYRSLGLDGEYDKRALDLASTVMAHLRGIEVDDVPPDDVSVAMLGVMLGLLLAEATGWEPPIPDAPSNDDGPP